MKLKRKIINHFSNKETIAFLHIGKNAGTAVMDLLQKVNDDRSEPYYFTKNGHGIRLRDIPQNQRFFFPVRSPITRFRSGFYSRKRKGMPRTFREWRPEEAKAFERFEHANDLAENLFSPGTKGTEAFAAMRSISHLKRFQYCSFDDIDFLFNERKPIHILRQEKLQVDMEHLFKTLSIKQPVVFSTDAIKIHKNDYSNIPNLSDKALENLREWFCADIDFVERADKWAEENLLQ